MTNVEGAINTHHPDNKHFHKYEFDIWTTDNARDTSA